LKTPSNMLGPKYTPGPGAYGHVGSFVSIPGSKIGTSTRDDEFKKAKRIGSPGPGAYRHDNTIAHSALKQDAPIFGFGTADRNKLACVGEIVSPGPGAYQHKLSVGVDGLKKTLSARRPESAPSYRTNPGPG
jgi:hypothetical protein